MDAPIGKGENVERPENPMAEITPEKKPRLYTLGEYLRREERSKERHEYFNGIIKPVPMARGPHNEIAANVIAALKNALKQTGKVYRVFSSNQKVYIPEINTGLYPDALVVSEKPVYHDEGSLLLTNPLLIVEVLSKSTRNFDLSHKFSYYKGLDSFREYVLIEQDKRQVEVWYREEPGLWRNTIINDPEGSVSLRSVDCEIRMADIYEHV